ncbi:MAG: heavy-metal-associated domain-containing protein [Candidatus Marinimicrobia bacterium]|jgi:copper chaperone CopZ|nr:heavy-metal-associated domain-containing protein [Candidatus Neomarinimicrobiota bacterium]|tara:strand:+ start:671 stop:1009 length:339 start_codon:yes stop_codon:yes gene_type:complete
MKLFLSIVCASFLISCSSEKTVAELKLDSMQCLMCSINVEEAIAGLDGVKKVEVDLKSKSGKVTYKASIINLDKIEKAIVSIGYNVNDKVADSKAYEKLEICCKMPEDVDLD